MSLARHRCPEDAAKNADRVHSLRGCQSKAEPALGQPSERSTLADETAAPATIGSVTPRALTAAWADLHRARADGDQRL